MHKDHLSYIFHRLLRQLVLDSMAHSLQPDSSSSGIRDVISSSSTPKQDVKFTVYTLWNTLDLCKHILLDSEESLDQIKDKLKNRCTQAELAVISEEANELLSLAAQLQRHTEYIEERCGRLCKRVGCAEDT